MHNLDTKKSPDRIKGSGSVRDGVRMGTQGQAVNPQVGQSPRAKVAKNLKGLVRDAAKLLDLQLQLLVVDLTDFWSKARLGLVGLIIASVGLLSTFPILLMGLSYVLEAELGWSRHFAFLTVAGTATVIGATVLVIGLMRLKYSVTKFSRSTDELAENLNWLRGMFAEDDAA